MLRAVATILLTPLFCGLVQAEPLLLAAASTGRALDAVLRESGVAAATSYGASGILARQIEQGAPADLYLSANPDWMAYLVDAGLIQRDTVTVLMSNRLVLISPEGADPVTPDMLSTRLVGEAFVMADPESAPVGSYGRAALQSLGLWDDIAPHHVPVRNTLAAVTAVARGEAAFGLVYASDAQDVPGIQVAFTLPTASHPEIRYLLARVGQGEDAAGAETLQSFLLSADGRAVLERFGFVALEGRP